SAFMPRTTSRPFSATLCPAVAQAPTTRGTSARSKTDTLRIIGTPSQLGCRLHVGGCCRESTRRRAERREIAEHRGDEFGDRGMNVNGALQDRVGSLGVHGVEHAVDRLVAARAQERRAENLL